MPRITVVGGGISGLSLAYLLHKQNPSVDLQVLESESRLGGKIWTEKTEGFLCEGGVNGFLDNKPKTLELAAELFLNPLRSSDSARKRFIYSNKVLHQLPEAPPSFLKSGLLSIRGRLRVGLEVFVPRGNKEDESLAAFARRRLGREAYEKLIDPMASGVYAGDPERLSLKSCFPRIHELEAAYGSLIRALIKLQVKARKEGRAAPGPGFGGRLTSFSNGMEELVSGLRASLGARVVTDSRIASLDKKGKGYLLYTSNGLAIKSDIVILAVPAYAAAGILRGLDPGLSRALDEILYPSLSVVCMGYRKDRIRHTLDGFGFLVPSREGRRILGTLWDSSIFPNRAPEGYVLLRTMIGGARASDLAMQPEESLADLVKGELTEIMGVGVQPDFVRAYTHEKAIPQYNVGHQKRLKLIDDLVLKYGGLYLTGNAYRGIGINDCIENSYRLSDKITGRANM